MNKRNTRLLKSPCKFTTIYSTTNSNTFLNLEDRTQKELQSSVVYKFVCPGCKASYIGKTDRCLATRLKEHTHCKDSEIYKHINSCEQFLYVKTLMNFPHTMHDLDIFPLESLILDNCVIIDKSKHWSLLLLKNLYIFNAKNRNSTTEVKPLKNKRKDCTAGSFLVQSFFRKFALLS